MPTRLQKLPNPQIRRFEEKLVKNIEIEMEVYLQEAPRMQLKDKKLIIKKIVRLCSGL
jgi:hypothetical protein